MCCLKVLFGRSLQNCRYQGVCVWGGEGVSYCPLIGLFAPRSGSILEGLPIQALEIPWETCLLTVVHEVGIACSLLCLEHAWIPASSEPTVLQPHPPHTGVVRTNGGKEPFTPL